jgi:hypothetical protein
MKATPLQCALVDEVLGLVPNAAPTGGMTRKQINEQIEGMKRR